MDMLLSKNLADIIEMITNHIDFGKCLKHLDKIVDRVKTTLDTHESILNKYDNDIKELQRRVSHLEKLISKNR